MGFVDYKRNSAETAKYLRTDATLAAALHAEAMDVAAEAEEIIAAEAYQTGALMQSVSVDREDLTGRFRRIAYRVQAEDPAAAPIEFGNKHIPPEQVTDYLGEAARRVGLDVREARLGD